MAAIRIIEEKLMIADSRGLLREAPQADCKSQCALQVIGDSLILTNPPIVARVEPIFSEAIPQGLLGES
jgi:hypothetical protein